MKITSTFIQRPVMTTLVMLGILFYGVVSYLNLPVSYLPAVDFPTIEVSAYLAGANPADMAANVATPLEKRFAAIAGLDSMSSESMQGATSVILQFDLDRNIDDAAMDVQAAISEAAGDLPSEMDSPPTFQKVNPADYPVLYLFIHSPTLPLTTVNDYAVTYLTQSISMIPGVAQVLIYGEKKYAVRVRLDPNELAARSIGLDEALKAVQDENVNLPLGSLSSDSRVRVLESDGQLKRAAEYAKIIVAQDKGKIVRLGDLGRVEDGTEGDKHGSWLDHTPGLTVAVKRQPGSNTIEVVDLIKERLPAIRAQLPASIGLDIIHDRSESIRESVRDVKFTLGLAVALVVMVVSIFLRNLAGTFIASISIPFSIIATFSVMYVLGHTLDNLSLMALTLAVGFVVDDAIVMLENVVRRMEEGEKPFQAALSGASEIGFTIVSMTLSLAVVFIPVMFMSGVVGRVLHEFAVTITAAILVSGVVSLSLTPMLCSRMLRPGRKLAEQDRLFNRLARGYEKSLGYALAHRRWVMLLAVLFLAATVHFFIIIPKGFLPRDDQGMLIGKAEAEQGTCYKAMAEMQAELTDRVMGDPNVRNSIRVVGLSGENTGLMVLFLKPRGERKYGADEVLAKIWPKVNSIPGLEVFLRNPPMIAIGGKSSHGQYMFTLLSPDADQLYAAAGDFEKSLSALPQVEAVYSDLKLRTPQVEVMIDRDRARTLNVSARSVESALYSAFGQRKISTIYDQKDEYKVILELAPEFAMTREDLESLYLRSDTGALVRLDAVVDLVDSFGPDSVNHSGQLPSVTYSFNAAPGVSLDQVTSAVQNLALRELPDTIGSMFEGEAGTFAESLGSLLFLLFMALAVIYIILGVLYESFIHPLTILSGLPSAALGGLLTLVVFGLELDLYGFVGVIMLIGIVKKNAIMVVDFALEAEKKGAEPAEAALKGAVVRFRPIMMTTLAAIMGAVPIALGYGAGGEARQPLGLVVVGGLVLSQVVTLYLTPVFYTYMDEFQSWLGGAGKREDRDQ